MSFVGNGMNSIVVVKDSINIKNSSTDNVKKAQRILKDLDSRNKEEIAELARGLFDGVIKTNLTDGLFLRNTTNIVIDWNENIDRKSFANLKKVVRGYEMTSKLLDWQRVLFNKLRNEKEAKKIYIFNDKVIDCFWVIADDLSADTILKYSEIYMDFLADNIDVVCDFMVFNEDEIENYNFPDNTIIMNCEG